MSTFDVDPFLARRMDNMGDLMGRLGLDPAAVAVSNAGTYGSAIRMCESCQAGELCHDWLNRAAATLYKAPAFCPNQDRFAQLIAGEMAALRQAAPAR
jgi:Family of unknown function (DUF6455)